MTEVVDHDHKQAITLRNYGNLPAIFHWEEKVDPEKIIARFEPSKGVVPPKSETKIYFHATVYTGGNINEIFICDIEDLELPLGFEFKADAYGLNVIYQNEEDNAQAAMSLT